MQVSQCGVCGKEGFSELWDLPKLPFTEKFGSFDPEAHPPIDQKLVICDHCAHIQLGFQVPPETLYQPSEYAFRTSESAAARRGSEFFLEFFNEVAGERSFDSLLDIGGNDLYLAKKMDVTSRCVIDPVCTMEDEQVKVITGMVEGVDLAEDIEQPNLVFCRHVLEHISSPQKLLHQLFSQCHEDSLYIFEIPCFDCLVEAGRFDAIFHQHYHYFDLDSFKQLLQHNGGRYIAHRYNHGGSCGGALLVAFEKGNMPISKPKKKTTIKEAIYAYCQEMEFLSKALREFPGPVYGYGASLMLATYAYHLKSDLSNLVCILDDDPNKEGHGYKNIPVRIASPEKEKIEEEASYLVTSLENVRPILKKLIEKKPRRIFVPSIV